MVISETKEAKNYRFELTENCIRITNLRFAGKRGKQVEQVAIYDLTYCSVPRDTIDVKIRGMMRAEDWPTVVTLAEAFVTYSGRFGEPAKIYMKTLRGVDVAPKGFKSVEVGNKYMTIKAEFDRFVVRDFTDPNEYTMIQPIQRTTSMVKKFYKWATKNKETLELMTFYQVQIAMRSEGIEYHGYCALD